MVPFVEAPTTDGLRLWFSAPRRQGRSQTRARRLALDSPGAAAASAGAAVLRPGPLGAFDDSGAMGSCLVEHGGDRRLPLLHRLEPRRERARSTRTSAARSATTAADRSSASRAAPVLGRSDVDPFFATSPWVLRRGRTLAHVVRVRRRLGARRRGARATATTSYAESDDGLAWRPTGRGLHRLRRRRRVRDRARRASIRDGDRYRMWFSHRGDAYRIGYAESADGLSWRAPASAEWGSTSSPHGWDSR